MAYGYGYGGLTTSTATTYSHYTASSNTVWINTKGEILPPPVPKLENSRPLLWLRHDMKSWLAKKSNYRPRLNDELRKDLKSWLADVKI